MFDKRVSNFSVGVACSLVNIFCERYSDGRVDRGDESFSAFFRSGSMVRVSYNRAVHKTLFEITESYTVPSIRF